MSSVCLFFCISVPTDRTAEGLSCTINYIYIIYVHNDIFVN